MMSINGMQKDLEMIQKIENLARKYKELELSEGVHSFELNKQKVEITSELMNVGIERQAHVRKMEVAPSGTRSCFFYDSKHFSSLKEDIELIKKEFPNLSWQKVEQFFSEMKQRYEQIAKEDEEFLRHTVLEVSADAFESIRLHLSKINEQFVLLSKRLRKINENKIIERQRTEDEQYKKDVESVRELISMLDSAEVTAQTYLESMHVDWRVTAQLNQQQVQEANKLYHIVMKIRQLQQQLENEIPELLVDVTPSNSFISVIEDNPPPSDLEPF